MSEINQIEHIVYEQFYLHRKAHEVLVSFFFKVKIWASDIVYNVQIILILIDLAQIGKRVKILCVAF